MNDTITKYGGWKQQCVTEIGWPTHTAGSTQQEAAIELVKAVIVGDSYDLPIFEYYMVGDTIYSGDWVPTNSEMNFGVVFTTATGKASNKTKYKLSYYSTKTMLDETNGAVYAGMLPFEDEDIQASLYLRDGKVTCVIWTKGEETTVTFEGENASAVDMYGNPVDGTNTFKIKEEPIYIRGLTKNVLLKNLPKKIENLVNDRTEAAFVEIEQNKGFAKAKEILLSDADAARELVQSGKYPTEEEALGYLERHYSLTDEILEMYKSGDYEYGVSFNEEDGDMVYCWKWDEEETNDSPDEWSTMIRDNDFGVSRYMVRIPKEDLEPLNFTEGTVFGFNAAFCDSEVAGRETYIELTEESSICARKNPSIFNDFTLINDDSTAETYAECLIPTVVGGENDAIVNIGDEDMFVDIKGHWAADIINSFAVKGLVNGVDENHFEPDRNITRAEFTTLLLNIVQAEMSEASKEPYSDVAVDDWHCKYINHAKNEGIIHLQVADTVFSPNEPILREEAFSISGLYWKKTQSEGSYKPIIYFDDCDKISDYAVEMVQVLYNNDIVRGDDNKLRPKDHLTRAEALTLLQKFY